MSTSSCSTSYYWSLPGAVSEFFPTLRATDISCDAGIKDMSELKEGWHPNLNDVSVTKEFPVEGKRVTQSYSNIRPSDYHTLLQCAVTSNNSHEFKACEQGFTRLFTTFQEQDNALFACAAQFDHCQQKQSFFPFASSRGIARQDFEDCCRTNSQHQKWEQCVQGVRNVPFKKSNGINE